MINKILEINGKKEYIRDLPELFRVLFLNKIIDLYTEDILKDELDLVSHPDPDERIEELEEKVDDLEWEKESLEDKVMDLEDRMDKIYSLSSKEYNL